MKKVKKKSFTSNLTKHQLIELDACTRCGECIKWCPVTALPEYKNNTPMDKIAEYRAFVQNEHGWRSRIIKPRPIPKERLDAFADAVYKCTTCGRCGVVCPVGIHCQELWPSIRANLVDLGYGPIESINEARRILEDKHNPFDLPYDERNNWIPKDFDNPQNADLAFFVGCELAYRTESMATGALKVLKAAGVQFTLLEDEWCCGFPLYVLGDRGEEFKAEIEHNIEQLKNKGVKKVVPSCPCCMNVMKRVWPKYYGKLPFDIVHILQVVADCIADRKIEFKKSFSGVVTYHDPCYLARGWGKGQEIITQPRAIIKSIPGIKFVEMEYNRRHTRCPGSGGGLRRTNQELSLKMAIALIKDAENTGANILLTSCPAVKERLDLVVEEQHKTDLDVQDILDFAGNLI